MWLTSRTQAKDKEQAVFHLYRIYNLHPVIEKNLRPEKPPKPFERSPKKIKKTKARKDDEDGEGSMGEENDVVNEGADAETESPKRRKTRARKVKSKTLIVQSGIILMTPCRLDERNHDCEGNGETLVGIAPPLPETPSKPPRKRATKKAKKETGTTPIVEDDTAIKMMNQEEYVQPVDGGDIETVEEDEHPEVLEATVEQKKRGRKKSSGNK